MPTVSRFDMTVIKAALENSSQHCPFHGQNWLQLGTQPDGQPRCDSCKIPCMMARALEVVNRALG